MCRCKRRSKTSKPSQEVKYSLSRAFEQRCPCLRRVVSTPEITISSMCSSYTPISSVLTGPCSHVSVYSVISYSTQVSTSVARRAGRTIADQRCHELQSAAEVGIFSDRSQALRQTRPVYPDEEPFLSCERSLVQPQVLPIRVWTIFRLPKMTDKGTVSSPDIAISSRQ